MREDFESVVKKLRKLNAKRIFVQYPEGLKTKIPEISSDLENENFEVVSCLESTYGACDIRDDEAERLGCDAVLHVAHADFGVKSKLPVVYWEYFFDVDPIPAMEKNFDKLKEFDRIGLVASLQYIPALQKIKQFLESNNKKVFTFKSEQYDGQILGCRVGAATGVDKNIDALLCITAGKFYSGGLLLKTSKPKFALNLEKNSIEDLAIAEKKMQKIKEWNKAQFSDAKSIGLLVSWKKGQMLGSPFDFKKKLENAGKAAYILAMDEISSKKLEGLKIDFLVNFACPRIEPPEFSELKIPILNYYEVKLD